MVCDHPQLCTIVAILATIGSPQGDSLSPVLFTYAGQPDPPVTSEGMSQEWEYVDFADEERDPLDSLLQTACTQLREWNLLVNESKTEFTHIYLAEAEEVDDQGAAMHPRQ